MLRIFQMPFVNLEKPFKLLTKTWKFGGCVFGSDVSG